MCDVGELEAGARGVEYDRATRTLVSNNNTTGRALRTLAAYTVQAATIGTGGTCCVGLEARSTLVSR